MAWIAVAAIAVLVCALLLRSVAVLSDWLLIWVLSSLYILLWLQASRPCPFEGPLGAASRA